MFMLLLQNIILVSWPVYMDVSFHDNKKVPKWYLVYFHGPNDGQCTFMVAESSGEAK